MIRNVLKFQNRRLCTQNIINETQNRFENDHRANYIRTTPFQKTLLAVGSAAVSLIDPFRHDMIACLGETTSDEALRYMKERMLECEEGGEMLRDRPRINSTTIDYDKLKSLPPNTLGKLYYEFLIFNGVTPDSRLSVQFIEDVESAYVMQRYREVHDLIHAVLKMKTHMLGEVTIKWIEALQTKMPMCIGGAIFGASRLKTKHRKLYLEHYLPWALKTGKNAHYLQSVYFEKRWEQPVHEFYEEMNISEFRLPSNTNMTHENSQNLDQTKLIV